MRLPLIFTLAANSTLEIMTFSSSLEVQLCDEAFLIYTYNGSSPMAQWLYNGAVLPDGSRGVNIIGGGFGHSLTVVHVLHASRNSGGTYTCNVTNDVISVKADFVLHIHGEFKGNKNYSTNTCWCRSRASKHCRAKVVGNNRLRPWPIHIV